MKVFTLPAVPRALLFDIDNTLYVNDEYCRLQVELLVKRFAESKRLEIAEAKEMIVVARKRHSLQTGGGTTSTGNILAELGVDLRVSARWRDELFHPENYLQTDTRTIGAVSELAERFRIAAVTNNTVAIGRRTLKCLGLERLIPIVVGLDTCYVSKPAAEPYQAALEQLDMAPSVAVSIGDRYDVDLAVPISMGMGGILIERLADLYELPALFAANQK